MASESNVRAQIGRLTGGQKLLSRKEIHELPKILWDDEEVLDACQGSYSGGLGLLVATQMRLIFVDKGMLWGLKVEDFPLDKISSIQYDTGLMLGSITIFTSGNKAVIANVEKSAARSFAESVRARISRPSSPVAASVPPQTVAPAKFDDVVAEIERFAGLKERGLITEDEFAAKKRQLLGL